MFERVLNIIFQVVLKFKEKIKDSSFRAKLYNGRELSNFEGNQIINFFY